MSYGFSTIRHVSRTGWTGSMQSFGATGRVQLMFETVQSGRALVMLLVTISTG